MQFPVGLGLCAGSVISPTVILTAANCLSGSSGAQVTAGAHSIATVELSQQTRGVPLSGYRIHAEYNPSNLNNDIATLIIDTPFIPDQFVQFVALPDLGTTETFAGELATVTGWGLFSDDTNDVSFLLRSAQNSIITNEVCRTTFGGFIISSTICMSTSGGHGACHGDNGGPLTVSRAGRPLQVGVSSFGFTAGCELGFPTAFTRVTSFGQWIIDNSL